MPLAGGEADKLGNRYETWWTVYQLVRILSGEADSIKIEIPGIDKAEFELSCPNHKEYHQAKRSRPSGQWSNATLISEGVITAVYDKLAGNRDRFVFASGSDASPLRELCDRARDATSPADFETNYLTNQNLIKAFDQIRDEWNCDASTAVDILQRSECRTSDERTLIENVNARCAVFFLRTPDDVCAHLRTLVIDSVHKELTRASILIYLRGFGIELRQITNLANARERLRQIVDAYLSRSRNKLIGKTIIPRPETERVLNHIRKDESPFEMAVIGGAGVGKSACLFEIVSKLEGDNIPTLVIRLDEITPTGSTQEIGDQLGLEESPVLVLSEIARAGKCVLIIDQLDAVSSTSGRNASFFEIIELLLSEAINCSGQARIYTIVACRAFDWESDSRFRRIQSQSPLSIELGNLSIEIVKQVLSSIPYNPDCLFPKQLSLLCLPQNLAIFIESGLQEHTAPAFKTALDLFSEYWDFKRIAVLNRCQTSTDHWLEVVSIMCDQINRTQRLNVPREKLDTIDFSYLAAITSEGVLSYDGKQYRFGHESFFDYCFARSFATRDDSIASLLEQTAQHLFRRAQVRQILAYLRDWEESRYVLEITAILASDGVRAHIKDLTLALVCSVSDPTDEEWIVLEKFIGTALESDEVTDESHGKLAKSAWRHFFRSGPWFEFVSKRDLPAKWIASPNAESVDFAIPYLRFHQRAYGDEVARLLSPYVGKGSDWSNRLRWIMEYADYGKSRSFFDLFLRLISDGTLDDARDRFASNGTFWLMLNGLEDAMPSWVPEVLEARIRRRITLVRVKETNNPDNGCQGIIPREAFGRDLLTVSASKAPNEFAERMIPLLLELTDACVYCADDDRPRRDRIWPYYIKSEHETLDNMVRTSTCRALSLFASQSPEMVEPIVDELRRRETYFANYLLLNAFSAAGAYYVEDVVRILSEQPWRYQSGYSDAPHWFASELVKTVAPYCSSEQLNQLECSILAYNPPWELKPNGRKWRGHASYTLLSAIPLHLRSKTAQSRLQELKRKFPQSAPAPKGIETGWVGPPIENSASRKMTDRQWLSAISKYQTERLDWTTPMRGGASNLAGVLCALASDNPERFANLGLQLPRGTNPVYMSRLLDGLKKSNLSAEHRVALCRKAFDEYLSDSGKEIADVLGNIASEIPEEGIEILHALATENPDPREELWAKTSGRGTSFYQGDMLTFGINTVRGRAAKAIRDLIQRDSLNAPKFQRSIESLVADPSLGVRACTASILLVLSRTDAVTAIGLFGTLINDVPDAFFATQYVQLFLYHNYDLRWTVLSETIVRMVRSSDPKCSEIGAQLMSLAALSGQDVKKYVAQILSGNDSQRLGLAKVAAKNIAKPDCRQWCDDHLMQLLDDPSEDVRLEVAGCFEELSSIALAEYEPLILAFAKSKAFASETFAILNMLARTTSWLPGTAFEVCNEYVARFGEEAADIRTRRAGDVRDVVTLLFRIYYQHQNDVWGTRCLDLIDLMSLNGINDIYSAFEEYER